MKSITITVTNADCEILDRVTIEVDDTILAIAYRPIATEIVSRHDEQTLQIGE